MLRAFLLIGLIALVQMPAMADAGVYDLPKLNPFCQSFKAPGSPQVSAPDP